MCRISNCCLWEVNWLFRILIKKKSWRTIYSEKKCWPARMISFPFLFQVHLQKCNVCTILKWMGGKKRFGGLVSKMWGGRDWGRMAAPACRRKVNLAQASNPFLVSTNSIWPDSEYQSHGKIYTKFTPHRNPHIIRHFSEFEPTHLSKNFSWGVTQVFVGAHPTATETSSEFCYISAIITQTPTCNM